MQRLCLREVLGFATIWTPCVALSSAAGLVSTLLRTRSGAVGRSWLLVFVILSAEGFVGDVPDDSGVAFFGDLAQGAVAIGLALVAVLAGAAFFQKVAPMLRERLPAPQPPPPPRPPGGARKAGGICAGRPS